jgi:thiamine-monophosphate kinase
VGLSDLAAVGAEPAWATLALTLPGADEEWLVGFARGFCSLAAAHGVSLVGGDTTRGPLSITVQAHGFVPSGRAVTRGGARIGDMVCVSGSLGEAGLALRLLQAGEPVPQRLRERLERPSPRVDLGVALRGLATAMIDVSDGLAADLGHILDASEVGAKIQLGSLPMSAEVASVVEESGDWGLPMASGDDYELCFTLAPERRDELSSVESQCACNLSVIGSIGEGEGLGCLLPNGGMWRPRRAGYDHFPG